MTENTTPPRQTRQRHIAWAPGMPLPKRASRRPLAAIISHFEFPVSARSLERWPLEVKVLGGVATIDVQEALSHARTIASKTRGYLTNAAVRSPTSNGGRAA
jgi:hypothetical protein